MSVKECSEYQKKRRRRIIRVVCVVLLTIIFLILLAILITWAVLQPKKPRFVLQDATIFAFNVSSPYLLTINLQVTVTSRNPNHRVGVYYERLDIFATYNNQQVTYYTGLPGGYQGHHDSITWSPFVGGINVPVAPFNGLALAQDQAKGAISLVIKIYGRIKWKVGTFTTGRYHLHVTCPAFIPFGGGPTPMTGTVVVGNGVKYQLSQRCKVSV